MITCKYNIIFCMLFQVAFLRNQTLRLAERIFSREDIPKGGTEAEQSRDYDAYSVKMVLPLMIDVQMVTQSCISTQPT